MCNRWSYEYLFPPGSLERICEITKERFDMTIQTVQEKTLPHSCGKCDIRWNGYATAHCGGCHYTFTCIGAFDAHRCGTGDTAHCKPPAQCGLVKSGRSYHCWGFPSDDDNMGAIARWKAKQSTTLDPAPNPEVEVDVYGSVEDSETSVDARSSHMLTGTPTPGFSALA